MAGELLPGSESRALDAITGRASVSAKTMYVALFTAAPTDSTFGTEVTTPATNGYARQSISFTAPTGDPMETHNDGVITFGPFSADLGNITHAVLMDSTTATATTNQFKVWQLDTARNPAANDGIAFAIGDLSITVD